MDKLTPKRKGAGLGLRTFIGKSGKTYLVLRTNGNSYHTFVETQAKEAALDCGIQAGHTRVRWKELWENS